MMSLDKQAGFGEGERNVRILQNNINMLYMTWQVRDRSLLCWGVGTIMNFNKIAIH